MVLTGKFKINVSLPAMRGHGDKNRRITFPYSTDSFSTAVYV